MQAYEKQLHIALIINVMYNLYSVVDKTLGTSVDTIRQKNLFPYHLFLFSIVASSPTHLYQKRYKRAGGKKNESDTTEIFYYNFYLMGITLYLHNIIYKSMCAFILNNLLPSQYS